MSSAAGTLSGPLPRQRILLACAWAVHLYTALGAAAGLLAIYYAAEQNFPMSFVAIGIAIFIDSSDGALARWVDVKHRVPSFDGSLLDNIVDYLTYTVAAVFLMLESGIIPKSIPGLVLACFIMLASVYGFCQTDAKTEDHYFLGFPNYWNIVAFYLYCLHWPCVINWAILIIFAVMVFVPIR
ncbi:MAG: CDP-alcohol phosphatidyltransferase family protein [Candidatus Binataceae bacterium]